MIILSIQNTFRTRRGRQSKPQLPEDNDPEVVDDEVVELQRLDEEDAEVVKVVEKKKKNDNNK